MAEVSLIPGGNYMFRRPTSSGTDSMLAMNAELGGL